MRESALAATIRLIASRLGARLFRNQVGTYRLADPRCKWCATHGRRISSGMGVGSPDLVGWQTVTITPAMVGRRIAVFMGVELKSNRRSPTAAQQAWLRAIDEAGGYAAVVHSEDEAVTFMEKGLTHGTAHHD